MINNNIALFSTSDKMVIEWITINWIEVYCHRHINYEDLAHTAMLNQEDGGAALVQYGVFLGNIN